MDDDDDGSAWAHQMELEQRQQEEALEASRKLTASFRASNEEFDRDMHALTERIRSIK